MVFLGEAWAAAMMSDTKLAGVAVLGFMLDIPPATGFTPQEVSRVRARIETLSQSTGAAVFIQWMKVPLAAGILLASHARGAVGISHHNSST